MLQIATFAQAPDMSVRNVRYQRQGAQQQEVQQDQYQGDGNIIKGAFKGAVLALIPAFIGHGGGANFGITGGLVGTAVGGTASALTGGVMYPERKGYNSAGIMASSGVFGVVSSLVGWGFGAPGAIVMGCIGAALGAFEAAS